MKAIRPTLGVLVGVALLLGTVAGCDDPTSSKSAAAASSSAANATGGAPANGPSVPTEAIDPNCHMTVRVGPSTPRAAVGGRTYYFCSGDCRDQFLRGQPRAAAPASGPSTAP